MLATSESPVNSKGEQLLSTVRLLIKQLEAQKSLERTERDRLLAIAVTDAQKLEAFIGHWLTH